MSYSEQTFIMAPTGDVLVHAVHQPDAPSKEKGSPIVGTGQKNGSL